MCLRLHPTAREVHGEVRIRGNIEAFDADWWLFFCWFAEFAIRISDIFFLT